MKLLFVHGTKLKKDKDGVVYTGGSYNQEIWNRYLTLTNDFSIISRMEPSIYEAEEAKNRFNYLDTDKINFIEIEDNFSSIKSYFDIRKHIKINKIIKDEVFKSDCIIVRLPSTFGNIAIKFAKKFNKPYLVEVVGCAWDSLWSHSIKGKILSIPNYIAMKRSIINAPYVLYVTSEFLQKRYPTKGINLGCSDVALPSLNEKILEQRIYKIKNMDSKKTIIIGTIGAVNVIYKGQKYIIEAISKLNNEGYNFEYHLVGGGDKSFLESVAKEYDILDKVKFHGSLPHEEIFNWLDTIDIYIQPSMTEGLPRALIEAMSRGCPSIGSNVGGIPELISSDFIFKSKDINDLAKKLIKILNGNMLREARENFNKSKEFESSVLNKKRNEFYLNYKNSL